MDVSNILTSKGTTTIPKQVRQELGLKPGNTVRFLKQANGTFVIEKGISLAEVRAMGAEFLKGKDIKKPTKQQVYDGMAQQAADRFNESLK